MPCPHCMKRVCTKRFCDGSCHPSGCHLRPRPLKPETDLRFLNIHLYPHLKNTLEKYCEDRENVFSADPEGDPLYVPPDPPTSPSSKSRLSGVTSDSFTIASSRELYGYEVRTPPEGGSTTSSSTVDDVESPGRSPEQIRTSQILRWLNRIPPKGDGLSTRVRHIRRPRSPSGDSSGEEVRKSKRKKVAFAS